MHDSVHCTSIVQCISYCLSVHCLHVSMLSRVMIMILFCYLYISTCPYLAVWGIGEGCTVHVSMWNRNSYKPLQCCCWLESLVWQDARRRIHWLLWEVRSLFPSEARLECRKHSHPRSRRALTQTQLLCSWRR